MSGHGLVDATHLGDGSTSAPLAALTFRFGHLTIDYLTSDDAVALVLAAARASRGALVVTSHIHHVAFAQRDVAFREALACADINVADGWPLVAASRLLGAGLPGRVAGIDLVDRILRADQRLRLAVLGGSPGSAELLSRKVRASHDVVLVHPLPPGSFATRAAVGELSEQVASSHANLVLLGIGAPRQELLAAELARVAFGPVVGCGAAIEVLAGVRPRAPLVLQRAGLEWAFRLALRRTGSARAMPATR